MEVEWPIAEAARTKLYCDRNGATVKTTLKYNSKLNQIHVVQQIDTDEKDQDTSDVGNLEKSLILDIFSLDDVIGADLEVKFAMNMSEMTESTTQLKNRKGESACLKDPLVKDYASYETSEEKASAILNIYCYPRAKPSSILYQIKECAFGSEDDEESQIDESLLGNRYAHHRHYQVEACEDFADIRKVVRAIRYLAKLSQNYPEQSSDGSEPSKQYQPRRYLVIMSPFSGTKQGRKVYDTHVNPMLEQSGIEHDLFITEHAGHARERMALIEDKSSDKDHSDGGKDISKYDAIIVMGGDGILNEMLQGLNQRSDMKEIMKQSKFGIVGCGTCNGLAASILHAGKEKYSPLESTFLICKGNSTHLDLSIYETACGKKYISFLTFSWAFIADCDIESERLRYLGTLRNDIWAVWRIINLRTYRAKFSYLPAVAKSEDDDTFSKDTTELKLPSLNEEIPEQDWITIEDDFINLWVSHVSHAASNLHHSPDSKLDDGIFRIFVIRRPISRFALTSILLKLETGTHISHDKVEFFNCKAFRLEPMTKGSFNDLDGEVIEPGPIQAQVMPSVMPFFTT